MQSAVLTWNLEEIWKQQNASVAIGKQHKYDTQFAFSIILALFFLYIL